MEPGEDRAQGGLWFLAVRVLGICRISIHVRLTRGDPPASGLVGSDSSSLSTSKVARC